jgi:TolB protein
MKPSQKSHSSAGYHNMIVVLFTLLCVLIGGSLALSPKAQTKTSDEQDVTPQTVPGRNGKIVFTGNSDIYTTEADGGNVQRLTDSPRFDYLPRWSPDGTKIAFVRQRDNNGEIYVMNADGSNQTMLTNDPADDYSPIFSPDGTRIAFTTTRAAPNPTTCFISPNCNVEIYVMNADGSNQTRLTSDPAYDYSPAWSPDGSRIAFTRGGYIYVMNADGSNQTQLTNSGYDSSPRWSPDSSRFTFTSVRDNPSPSTCNRAPCNVEIYSMNADGSNQTRLTNNPAYDVSPEWSPDGSRIAFVNLDNNNDEIYVMNADGSNQTRLTNNPAYDHSPIFSPDGTRIAFLSNRDKIDNGWDYNEKIYVMNADGSSQTRLTNTADNVYEGEPDWQALPQAAANPIDTADFFVRQHYRDFLSREPDPAGLAFWTNEITSCGADAQCVEAKRINVSAAFYLSIEFQGTGYLVERVYKAAYGDATGTSTFGGTHQIPVPIIRLNEFLPDTQEIGNGVIVNQPGWEQVLENNKQAFLTEFVQRNRFTTAYPQSMTAGQFVDKLNDNAGNVLSVAERDQLVNELTALTKTRAQVLRAVAEDANLNTIEFDRAFVLMQYFGYLRRNPNDAPDSDYTGFDFWLGKLNQFNGNYINAEMVKAFIVSGEYRGRFGP